LDPEPIEGSETSESESESEPERDAPSRDASSVSDDEFPASSFRRLRPSEDRTPIAAFAFRRF
jgi:hypothetical protein